MRTSSRPLIDKILDGTLTEKLTEWRAAGDSFEAIGRRFETDHGITVSTSTIFRWCAELDIPTPASPPVAEVGS